MKNINHDEFGLDTSKIGSTVHPFELAGLGKAPFQYVGFEHRTFQASPDAPVQCGGSCQYCGTGITNFFFIESSDGKKFHVGCDCVEKTGDKKLIKIVNGIVARNNAKLKAAKDKVKIDTARENIKLESIRTSLSSKPHPFTWRAEQGDTLLNYVEYLLSNGGTSGRLRAAKFIKEFAV